MSNEIFISYRRSDSGTHARLMRDALLTWFEKPQVFFDHETIEVATRFKDVIAEAMAQCIVVLVLIGPRWSQVEYGGQRRLHNPDDLVRQEVLRALSSGKSVIPVLLDGAAMPQREDLPPELADLCSINAHVQSPAKAYDDDLRRLAELIVRLGVLQRRRELPSERDKLPFLCDRGQQQQALSDAVGSLVGRAQRPPMVLTLLGCADEAHWAFIARLELFSLPRLFKKTPLSPGDAFVRINDALPLDGDQARFDHRLRNAIATKLMLGMVEDDESLLRQIKDGKRATLVVVLSWHLSELGRQPELALQRVFNYWERFPPLGIRLFAACVVCLKYDRQEPAQRGLWARVTGRATAARDDRVDALKVIVQQAATTFAVSPRVAWSAPPELSPVTSVDLDRWLDAVHEEGGLRLQREALLATLEGQPRSMEWLMPKLKALLTAA